MPRPILDTSWSLLRLGRRKQPEYPNIYEQYPTVQVENAKNKKTLHFPKKKYNKSEEQMELVYIQ